MSQKMSREELHDLVEMIVEVYDKKANRDLTAKECDALVLKFEANINHPDGSDLIFYPTTVGLPKEPTIDEILDLALKGLSDK